MDSKSEIKSDEPKEETIRTYLRLRPTVKNTNHINLNEQHNMIQISVAKNVNSGYINNSKENYSFKFDKVFGMQTSQDTVFNDIAKDVIDSTLDGYNGTIFAYGQTGSGKTYTITGGAERLDQRGIIPRAISYIFSNIKSRPHHKWKVYVSYLEIYNNNGYDLLHENHGKAKDLDDLPRVKVRENASKQLLLYNLSVHCVENEEEAMVLLLLGDENRVVAETPKNDASTRSHCIFTFQIESQKIGEDSKTLSKLHIVDLSGSEKPYKSSLDGIRMEEALNINLSLHFLESVIVSLNKKEGHIPYRNSMMTMCLRDSLGGNCKTRMIATLSLEEVDIMESISTCRFAQRVALVQNSAVKNEIEDPELIIQKQKVEIEDLKSQLSLIKGENQKSVLDREDMYKCKTIVDEYLKHGDYSSRINLKDMLMINECFSIIKVYYKDLEKKYNLYLESKNKELPLQDGYNKDRVIELTSMNKKLNEDIERLKEIVKRRDEETKVLLTMIDKYKGYDSKKTLLSRLDSEDDSKLSFIKNNFLGGEINFKSPNISKLEFTNNEVTTGNNTLLNNTASNNISNYESLSEKTQGPFELLHDINKADSYLIRKVNLNKEILSQRLKAYEVFRNNYIKSDIKKENLRILNDEKFEKGKKIGENVTKIREKCSLLKNEIVEIRKRKIVENVDDLKDPNNLLKLKEESLLKEFQELKMIEKKDGMELKAIHDEIKSIQALVDANDKKMAKDFEFWYEIMLKKFEWETKNGKLLDKIDNYTESNTNETVKSSHINNFLIKNDIKNNDSSFLQLSERISMKKEKIFTDVKNNSEKF